MNLLTTRRRFVQGGLALGVLPMLSGTARTADKIKVAGVHASPVENAWNSRIHLALNSAAKDGLIDYVFSEGVSATDYPRAMREYADQGAQLIWGESYAVETEARQVATDYPKTAFLMGSSGGPQGDNFGVFGTRVHEACYLAGMLGAKLSKSGTFGSVGGYPICHKDPQADRYELARNVVDTVVDRTLRHDLRVGPVAPAAPDPDNVHSRANLDYPPSRSKTLKLPRRGHGSV